MRPPPAYRWGSFALGLSDWLAADEINEEQRACLVPLSVIASQAGCSLPTEYRTMTRPTSWRLRTMGENGDAQSNRSPSFRKTLTRTTSGGSTTSDCSRWSPRAGGTAAGLVDSRRVGVCAPCWKAVRGPRSGRVLRTSRLHAPAREWTWHGRGRRSLAHRLRPRSAADVLESGVFADSGDAPWLGNYDVPGGHVVGAVHAERGPIDWFDYDPHPFGGACV